MKTDIYIKERIN